MIKSPYLIDINIYNNKNILLHKCKNEYDDNILILKDIKIGYLLEQIEYIYCSKLNNKLINRNNIFIYNKQEKIYNILFSNNIEIESIKEIIIKEMKLTKGEDNYNKTLNNLININDKTEYDLNILTLYDVIEELKVLYNNNFNDDILSDIYHVYIINIFPLIKFKDFYNLIKNNNYDSQKQLNCDYQREIIEQIRIIEFTDEKEYNKSLSSVNKYITDIVPRELIIETNIRYFMVNPPIDLSNNMMHFEIENDVFLSIYNELIIEDYDIYSINYIKLKIQDNEIEKYDIIISDDNVYSNLINLDKINKYLIVRGFMKNEFNNLFTIILTNEKIYINFGFNQLITYKELKTFTLQMFFDFIIKIISNNIITFEIDNINYHHYYNLKIDTLITFDLKKVLNIILYLDYYFSVINDLKNIILSFNLDNNVNNSKLIYINNYLKKNNIDITNITEKQKQELIELLNISKDELMNFLIDFENVNTNIKKSIHVNKNIINISKINNLNMVDRIYDILKKIIDIYTNNKIDINNYVKNYNISSFYMYNIDYYKNNELSEKQYWSKECQNSGNKIRKPKLYNTTKEEIDNEYDYDKITNTYIHKKTKERRIMTDENILIGCDQSKNNITRYIGFLNSCSLCCFNTDQFLNIKKSRIRNKIKQCLNIEFENNEDFEKTSRIYKYKYSKIIGDYSIIDDIFVNNINPDNHLFILIDIGPLNFDQNINKLLFYNEYLINASCFDESTEYELYYYNYPYLYQFVYLSNMNRLKKNEKKFKVVDSDNNLDMINFLKVSKIKYNNVIPINPYNIYFNFKTIIKNYLLFDYKILFNTYNNLSILVKYIDNIINYNTNMFRDLKCLDEKDFVLQDYKSIENEIINFCETNKYQFKVTNILHNNNFIFAVCLNNNLILIFKQTKVISDYFKNYKRVENIDIYYSISEIRIEVDVPSYIKFYNPNLLDYYHYYLFKYNFFLMLYNNNLIKENLLNIIKNQNKDSNLYNKIHDYLLNDKNFSNVFNNFFTVEDKDKDKIKDKDANKNKKKYRLIIDNDLSKTLIENNNILLINDDQKYLYFKRIITELMYDFSSLYNYVSRFIDSKFSDNSELSVHLNDSNLNIIDINKKNGKLIDNIFYQEIYHNDNDAFYRALSNIYYWNSMIKLGFNKYDDLNLGYKFDGRNKFLIIYMRELFDNNVIPVEKSWSIYQKLTYKFNKNFDYNVNLIINTKDSNVHDNKKNITNTIYINTDSLLISSLSVANYIK